MKIDILGIPYEVVEVDTIDKSVRTLGQIDFPNQTIKLAKGMGKECREQTLLHEIVHGIFEGLGYDYLNSDEEKVQGIASALYQVLSSQSIFSFIDHISEKTPGYCSKLFK